MMKKIFLLSSICLVLLSACSTNEDTGTFDIRQTSLSEMHEPGQSTATEEIPETESQTETTQTPGIYEGEYTGNTISDPDYDGLEIQKNEDDTYAIQVKIPFLTSLYECTGYQSGSIILFSTSEWGADKKVEGSISFDDDSATVTFTSGWYQTATTESSYQYHKTSDTPNLESGPDARPDYSSFTGEYCDANDDPSLEIQLNEDGSYLIQISIFREIGYDGCIGSLSEGKMSFASDQRGGVSGSITLDNDLAVVQFEQIGYFENSKVTTYLFHKTSPLLNDIPDRLNETAYFLSTDSDFYEKAACNPIDQKFVIEEEAAPLEIWQSALEKCEAWNQQIDFTGSKLQGLLNEADYEQLQNAISLWHEYYQEEVSQNRELYGNNGLILGSMYTAVSADVLVEKCRFTAFTLLSQEYELSGDVSFAENTAVTNEASEYSLSPQSFCIEYSPDFEEMLISYSIDEKNSDELEELIHETANKIEEEFGHDFAEHTDKYVSFIHALYTVENDISEDSNLCLILKENRLKLYVTELLNIVYMLDSQ